MRMKIHCFSFILHSSWAYLAFETNLILQIRRPSKWRLDIFMITVFIYKAHDIHTLFSYTVNGTGLKKKAPQCLCASLCRTSIHKPLGAAKRILICVLWHCCTLLTVWQEHKKKSFGTFSAVSTY